ncbi:MAG: glycoside hydrolase family 97 N-terminal domain-containing protein, partial [Verrucomicrobiae bacterium]|nr:glycoside hydrolase family 97 N-terminal domain-containing protein [Verrucomicrobiae bacterium]
MLRQERERMGRRAGVIVGFVIAFMAAPGWAASLQGPWNVTSPDGRNRIEVSLNEEGEASFRVRHRRRWVLEPSPLGLTRGDQSFVRGLSWVETGPVIHRQESYDLVSGNRSQVESLLAQRSLVFSNADGARVVLDLAASDEGVAFRYRFPETNTTVRVVQSERTGFVFASDARGWMQPYHVAGQYTPAYEDYYYAAAPTDLPSSVRAKPLGWAFPVLLHAPSARTWLLLTESGTDGGYCGTHLAPADGSGVLRIAFPADDEGT